jgi:iron-sulfur cluster repair protein YtfE (RIC family)
MTAPDLFTLPHKALRAWIGATATAVGGLDTTNLDDQRSLVGQFRLLLADLADHAQHEDDFIVPVLDRHVPHLAHRLRGEHVAIDTALVTLGSIVDELEQAPSPALQLHAYRALRNFEGQNMAHLDFEETEIMPALWRAVAPDDLFAVFQAFKTAHPESVQLYCRIPDALTPQERALVFA